MVENQRISFIGFRLYVDLAIIKITNMKFPRLTWTRRENLITTPGFSQKKKFRFPNYKEIC